jgi:hypothetical protein
MYKQAQGNTLYVLSNAFCFLAVRNEIIYTHKHSFVQLNKSELKLVCITEALCVIQRVKLLQRI